MKNMNMWMWFGILALVGVIFFVGYSYVANQKKFKPNDGCEFVCTSEVGDPGNGLRPSPICKKVCPL